MNHVRVVEYRTLHASDAVASSMLFPELRHSVLVQLTRLKTGKGPSFSVFVVYREEGMTFEVSGRLAIAEPCRRVESLLVDLIHDDDFLATVLLPLDRQVVNHFAPERSSA